jgi:hypothetical protein
MKEVDLYTWKQFMEGQAREIITDLTQQNNHDEETNTSFREYYFNKVVVARLTTNENDGSQKLEVDESLMKKVEFIYIPTDEEYEQWDEEDFETNTPIAQIRIAEKEGREWVDPRGDKK